MLIEEEAAVEAFARVCISTLGRSALTHIRVAESRRIGNRRNLQHSNLPIRAIFINV